MKNIIFILLLLTIPGFAQRVDPDSLLSAVKSNFEKVNDYTADVNIKIDVEFLKVPETNATIYFKSPDKMKVESEGFAMLPRDGLNFSPDVLTKEKHTAIFVERQDYKGFNTAILKIIPLNDKSELILHTVWIDLDETVIRRVETTTKGRGTFTVELSYENEVIGYPLPSKLLFSFNLRDINIPRHFRGAENDDEQPEEEGGENGDEQEIKKGTVTVTYSDYNVNSGLPDSLFEEEEK
jgi:outer membrane lipoprotein-sorting protein